MQKKVEALLFASGDEGLSIQELSKLLKVDRCTVEDGVYQLSQRLDEQQSSLHVVKQQERYLLTTRKEMAPLLKMYTNATLNARLSKATLEVLAIIAYKQPLTRLEIDEIRGVQSTGSVQKLQARQLIQEVGKVDGPGRAKLLGTTDYFLEYFDLQSLDDLPPLEEPEEIQDTQMLFEQFNETFDKEE